MRCSHPWQVVDKRADGGLEWLGVHCGGIDNRLLCDFIFVVDLRVLITKYPDTSVTDLSAGTRRRDSNGFPFLEVHHVHPLGKGREWTECHSLLGTPPDLRTGQQSYSGEYGDSFPASGLP